MTRVIQSKKLDKEVSSFEIVRMLKYNTLKILIKIKSSTL